MALLRISRELDIVGDVSAILDSPSELIAWASILDDATVAAWRAHDSGHRYLQVAAPHTRAPIRGRVAAVLLAEQHPAFWQALDLEHVSPGESVTLGLDHLAKAWAAMPITPPDSGLEPPAPPEVK